MAGAGTEIRVADNPQEHRYEVFVGQRLAGFVTYHIRGERITLIHTEVAPEFEDQGLGRSLARGALDDIRTRGLSVDPICSFIRDFINKNPEYSNLVA